jgi:hypothetical protein
VLRLDWTTLLTGIIALMALLTFLSQRRLTIFAQRAQLVLDPKAPHVAEFAVGHHPRPGHSNEECRQHARLRSYHYMSDGAGPRAFQRLPA